MRLGLAVGRPDWENLAKELTPYQIQVWRAYEQIEPFGERRADMRMAMNTIVAIQANREKPLGENTIDDLSRMLTSYVDGCEEVEEISPDQAVQKLFGGSR